MARKVFFSFHYKPDNSRAAQVRNIGVIEGNRPTSDNGWEEVKKGGDKAIEKWISEQMTGRSCVVVLIGADTAGRKWINHEIAKAWNDGRGLVGVHIHNLKDLRGEQGIRGENPFDYVKVGETKLSSIVKTYNPPFTDSQRVYAFIAENIEDWLEESLLIRKES